VPTGRATAAGPGVARNNQLWGRRPVVRQAAPAFTFDVRFYSIGPSSKALFPPQEDDAERHGCRDLSEV